MSNVNINEALRKAAESLKNGVDKKNLSTFLKELAEYCKDEKKPAYSYRKEIAASKAAQLERVGKRCGHKRPGSSTTCLRPINGALAWRTKTSRSHHGARMATSWLSMATNSP